MINTFILTLASLIGADGYETIPVVTSVPSSEVVLVCNGYGCGAGGCRSGGCSSGGCSSGGCASGNCSPGYSGYSYYSRPYVQSTPVYTLPTLNLIIADMPTNEQRNRFYVKARVNGKMYNIPVINGIIPTINSRHENELILTYSTGKQFHSSMFGDADYVNYSTHNSANTTVSALKTFDNGGVKARTEPTVSALKLPDAMPKETPLRATRPEDDKVDNFLRNAAPSAPKRVINDTLDNFLQKPSSIGDSDRAFPRY